MPPIWQILLGSGIIVVACILGIIIATYIYPFLKFRISKAQMLGWLEILKQNEGEKENKDGEKKRK